MCLQTIGSLSLVNYGSMHIYIYLKWYTKYNRFQCASMQLHCMYYMRYYMGASCVYTTNKSNKDTSIRLKFILIYCKLNYSVHRIFYTFWYGFNITRALSCYHWQFSAIVHSETKQKKTVVFIKLMLCTLIISDQT